MCGLVVIVAFVGVNEKEVLSKGKGGCPVSSFATLVETQKKRHLEHDNFISHINPDTMQKKKKLNKPSLTT